MRKTIVCCLFCLLYGFLLSQNGIRFTGFGIGLNHTITNKYSHSLSNKPVREFDTNINPYYQYNAIYPIKNSNLYFLTGTKLTYHSLSKDFILTQKLGLAIFKAQNNGNHLFYSFGTEIDGYGYGLYTGLYAIVKKKKIHYVISPEINYLFSDLYAYRNFWGNFSAISVGCGISAAWDKKEFVPKKVTKISTHHQFNIGISIGDDRIFGQKRENRNYAYSYLNINGAYRILNRQIISPEVGLGLLVHYDMAVISGYVYFDTYDNEESLNYVPYTKIGFSIEGRRRFSFSGNFYALKMFSLKGGGYSSSIGIKYDVSNKLSLSTALETIYYAGNVFGWKKIYNEYPNNYTYISKKPFFYGTEITLIGIRTAVHF